MGSNLAARDVSNCSMRGFLSIQAFEYVFEYLLLQYSRAARISIHEKNKYFILTRVYNVPAIQHTQQIQHQVGSMVCDIIVVQV